ncbi:hypothetical protein PR003_g8455 [Phytophthora rubi]|uniref:RxLR effector protein n=1 Tax=Phytophthora rubi TaxID=129364 RepID=A0A6A3NH10_9STRA|nr:hypothetical protein PR002_g9959 [Phytophthora rubi]KAE9042821.1 hypothetical protein PR001_g6038 [Phytophthora rubi]KAE9344468.1 hypothetical protein PR003_g8455 [Phytophthora rubi]
MAQTCRSIRFFLSWLTICSVTVNTCNMPSFITSVTRLCSHLLRRLRSTTQPGRACTA